MKTLPKRKPFDTGRSNSCLTCGRRYCYCPERYADGDWNWNYKKPRKTRVTKSNYFKKPIESYYGQRNGNKVFIVIYKIKKGSLKRK